MANDDEERSIEISVEIDAATMNAAAAQLREAGEESTLTAKRPALAATQVSPQMPADLEPNTLQPTLAVHDLGSVAPTRKPALSASDDQPTFPTAVARSPVGGKDDDDAPTGRTREAKIIEQAVADLRRESLGAMRPVPAVSPAPSVRSAVDPQEDEETETDVRASAKELAKEIERDAAEDARREQELDAKAAQAANVVSLPKSARQLTIELMPKISPAADDDDDDDAGGFGPQATVRMAVPAEAQAIVPAAGRPPPQVSPMQITAPLPAYIPAISPRPAQQPAQPAPPAQPAVEQPITARGEGRSPAVERSERNARTRVVVPRRRGSALAVFFVFMIAAGAGGAAFYFGFLPTARRPPDPATTTPHASASAPPAPSPSASPSASASASASPSASASASPPAASPSASSSGRRPPRRR